MKKTLLVILSLLLLCAMFAGCSEKKEGYTVLEENFGSEEYGIGFRLGDNALTLKVQSIIDEMITDGKAAEISKTWFGSDQLIKNAAFPREIKDTGDKSLEKITQKGTLILGLDVGFEPMGYYDEKGEIIGFDIDLAREVAKRLGVELKLQPITWSAKEMELSSGNIDMIWNGMSITPERVEAMNISKPYKTNSMIIITKDGSGITAKAGLAGKKVAVQAGSSALDAINAEPEVAATFEKIVEFDDNLTAFLDLKAGRVDALVVDEVVGLFLIERQG